MKSFFSKTTVLSLTFLAGAIFTQLLVPSPGLIAQSGSGNYPKELTSYRDIVKRALPAVVSIQPLARRGVGREPIGVGSGVIVDATGIVLTNHHVIDGAEQIIVYLEDGRKIIAREARSDKKTDLAILKIQSDKPLPSLSLADSAEMEVGDRVLAIGAPFGLSGTVTHGIISAKDRSLRLNAYEDFIQTDAAVNPGNSGGPLINMEGKIVGINSVIKSKSGGFQGISLAISSNMARRVMKDLLREGIVKRGYLGISILDITEPVARKLGVAVNSGVVVTRIFENSPAVRAGLKVGDILQKIDDKVISDGDTFTKTVADLYVNRMASLTVLRDGKPIKLSVIVEQQPENFGIKD